MNKLGLLSEADDAMSDLDYSQSEDEIMETAPGGDDKKNCTSSSESDDGLYDSEEEEDGEMRLDTAESSKNSECRNSSPDNSLTGPRCKSIIGWLSSGDRPHNTEGKKVSTTRKDVGRRSRSGSPGTSYSKRWCGVEKKRDQVSTRRTEYSPERGRNRRCKYGDRDSSCDRARCTRDSEYTRRRRYCASKEPARCRHRTSCGEGEDRSRYGDRHQSRQKRTCRKFGLPERPCDPGYANNIVMKAWKIGRSIKTKMYDKLERQRPPIDPWEESRCDGIPRSILETPTLTWNTLLIGGPRLRKIFSNGGEFCSISKGAREAALRCETLLNALESADETLSWLKFHDIVCEPALADDPIFRTAGAVLDNLRLKLTPVLNCRSCGRTRSLDDMLRRASQTDMTDPISFILIMITRLTNVMRRRNGFKSVMLHSEVDPVGALAHYEPKDCIIGVVGYLLDHVRLCRDPACISYISCILDPSPEPRGKYFLCE